MNHEILEYLKELIEEKYGTLNCNLGSSHLNDKTNEYEWVSISDFVELIDRADKEFEEY